MSIYVIILLLVFLVGGIMSVIQYRGLSKEQKYAQIQGWLLQAVLLAEREFGSGTGRLKLSAVYDKFCGRFPWLARVISFPTFSVYVDDTLIEMKEILGKNNAIASIIERGDGANGVG